MTSISMVFAVLERLQSWFAENSPDSQLTTEGIQENLNSLWSWKDILLQRDADAEKKYLLDEDFRKQVKKMMPILYGIENLVESYQVGAISRGNYYRRGCTKSIFRNISDFKAKEKFQAELHSMTDQIRGLKDSLERDGGDLPSQQPGASSSRPWNNLVVDTIRIDPWIDQDIIAIDEDLQLLLQQLLEGSANLEVISICGMGGLGKTTLARKLYNYPQVMGHFSIRIWVAVGQMIRRHDIFLSILDQVLPSPLLSSTSSRLDDIELASQVRKCLLGKRWLLVLDDLWNTEAWEGIKLSFPVSQPGNRVLVTTRNRDVARFISGNGYIHASRLLSQEESWALFMRRAQLTDIEFNSEQEEIVYKLVICSGGLPFAVDLLAGILKTNALEEWKSVLQALEVSPQHQRVQKIVELSFNNLPPVLKSCLLYMASFPEESKFETDTLYQLWIAEGLVSQKQCQDGETMMNVAAQYFYNLAARRLVKITEEEMSDHRSFSCGQLHDLIRDYSIKLATEEQFFMMPWSAYQPADSVLRRAIYLDKHEDIDIRPYSKLELRTLLFFNSFHQYGEELAQPQVIPDLSNLKWIKILHFDGVKFKGGKLPAGVANLFLLRYLSLKDCYLEELPSSIGNFLFLQTLDLRIRKQRRVTLPNVLFKLERLKHLYLPLEFQTPNGDKLLLDGMKELEILENFDTSTCNAGEIFLLTSFRCLVVTADGNIKDLQQIFGCVESNKHHLCKTSLDIRNFDCYSEQRVSFIKNLLSCPVLHIFRLEGRINVELGEISQSFTIIHLNGSQLDHDPMQALKKLRNLRVLVLEVEAYTGKEMCCSGRGFPELRSLKISKLYNLEALKLETEALPVLSTLEIENCRRLKTVPEGLRSIYNLTTLKIGMMPKGFVGRLRKVDSKGGEDLDKINSYCTIEFGNDDPWPEYSDSPNQQKPSFDEIIAGVQTSSSTESETRDLAASSRWPPQYDQRERDDYLQ